RGVGMNTARRRGPKEKSTGQRKRGGKRGRGGGHVRRGRRNDGERWMVTGGIPARPKDEPCSAEERRPPAPRGGARPRAPARSGRSAGGASCPAGQRNRWERTAAGRIAGPRRRGAALHRPRRGWENPTSPDAPLPARSPAATAPRHLSSERAHREQRPVPLRQCLRREEEPPVVPFPGQILAQR